METLKQHWLAITLTVIITSAVVGTGGLVYGISSASAPTPPAQLSAQTDQKIKGNKNSMIYHLPGCASYDRIAEKNIVWFKTEAEAQATGYRKAKNC